MAFSKEHKTILQKWYDAAVDLGGQADASKWPMPDQDFLLEMDVFALQKAIDGDVRDENCGLYKAFYWDKSPQGYEFWELVVYCAHPFTDEHIAILKSWLDARQEMNNSEAQP